MIRLLRWFRREVTNTFLGMLILAYAVLTAAAMIGCIIYALRLGCER